MILHRKNVEIEKKNPAMQTEPKYNCIHIFDVILHAFQTGPKCIHIFDITFVKFWHVSVLMLLCYNDYVAISRLVANGRSLRRNTAI